jgi:hypothetical protein
MCRVLEGSLDLSGRQSQFLSDDRYTFARRYGPDDGCHVNPRSCDTWLTESDVGIHGDAREDLHVATPFEEAAYILRSRRPDIKEPPLSQGLLEWGVLGLNQ